MEAMIQDQKVTERRMPPATHPADCDVTAIPTEAKIWTVQMVDGTPASIIQMPDGRRLGLDWVSIKACAEMDAMITAVTRRQAREQKSPPDNTELELNINVQPQCLAGLFLRNPVAPYIFLFSPPHTSNMTVTPYNLLLATIH